MKRIAIFIASVATLLAVGVPALAASSSSGAHKDVVLESTKTFDGSYIRAGENVTIDGTVNGDVIVAASSVAINGDVRGSVYVAASDVTIRGKVTGNIHVVASRVKLENSAASVYSASSSLLTTNDTNLSGALMAVGSTLDISGKIAHPSYLAGSTIAFNAQLGGSLATASTELRLGPDAVVQGDLTYSEKAQLSIDNDKAISGSIKKTPMPAASKQTAWSSKLFGALLGVTMMFVLGLVLLKLAPKSVFATSQYLGRYPARSLLVGFGFVILTPILLIVGFFSLVGIPLAVLGLMAYLSVFVVTDVFVALWLGRKVTRQSTTNFGSEAWALVLGLLILALLRAVPVLGGFVAVAVFLAGSGAIVARSWERFRHVGKLQAKS